MADTKRSAEENNRIAASVLDRVQGSGIVSEGAVIVVGFSGGPDSLCLLHTLNELADSMSLTLVPVHVNHHLRGEKADEEQARAIEICEKMDLDCLVYEIDCQEMADELGISTEEAGRMARYQIFDDAAAQLADHIGPENVFIALAHNADDQSETVLMRLMRGTGVHGLAGISAVRQSDAGFLIIRPLIDVTRDDIETYIKVNKLRPNIDESNAVADVTRNKIRLKLLPYIEKNYNPNIKQALRRYAEIAAIDDSFMEDVALGFCAENMDFDTVRDALVLDITELAGQHVAICRRVIVNCLKAVGIMEASSYDLVLTLLNLVYTSNPSASLDLPGGMIAQREYDNLVFMPKSAAEEKNPADDFRLMPQVLMRKDFNPAEGDIYAAFDFDAFNEVHPGQVGNLCLRTRREGDFIPIKDGKSKKLQDFFVDEKIVQSERDKILVVAIGSEILWIVPNAQMSSARHRENGRFSQK